MKIVFAGTSEFAIPAFEALINSHHSVLALITQPDRHRGRGRELICPLIKEIAIANNITVIQPERMRDKESIEEIKRIGDIDVMVVAAYGQIIPKEILEWPKYGCVNIHGSILPKYRGAAPIQYALIDGEKETGITTMLMDEGLDTGDILLIYKTEIKPDEVAGDLFHRLSEMGTDIIIETLERLESNSITPISQNNELSSKAPSLAPDAGYIDWSMPAEKIVNLYRGCTPKPGAFTSLDGVKIKIWKAKVENIDIQDSQPGSIISLGRDGIVVCAGQGSVRIIELQPESRKRMDAASYICGSKICIGHRFDVRVGK
ncbi:MAG: methionyl-tRNA formyltransferase [Armatimonadota bacterium]